MRVALSFLILTSTAISAAEPYSGDFATEGVFDASADDDTVVRNHLELTQTGARLGGLLVIASNPAIPVTGSVLPDGTAALVIGSQSLPLARVKGGIELTVDGSTHLFKRVPSLKPLPAVALGAGAASTGARFASPWGWSVAAPAGWTATRAPGSVRLEGERIVITALTPRTSTDPAADALARVLADQGGEWQPLPRPTRTQLPDASASVLEVAGIDDNEVEWRARAVEVSTKLGAVVITGIARVGDLASLRARVDAVARSAKLAVAGSPAAARFLVGEWWSFEQVVRVGSQTGVTYTISLCADGSYIEVNDTSGVIQSVPGTPGMVAAGSITIQGRWIAVGDQAGTLHILSTDGKVSEMAYRMVGSKMSFANSRPYSRKQLGRCSP